MSEVTFDQAEKLSQRANVTMAEAKEALAQHNGDMLDAFLWLESQRKTAPRDGGFYSTRGGSEAASEVLVIPPFERYHKDWSKDWRQILREIGKAAINILRHSTLNYLQVWRKGDLMASIPILILVLLFIVAPYVMLPLTIIGFICGCRYRFAGPDLGKENINKVMDQVSGTVQDTVDRVKSEFQDKHRK